MAENMVVNDLLNKLKLFHEAVMPLRKGGLIKSTLIPPHIRAEAANIYRIHGGLDILMDVLHVSAEQIRVWSKKIGGDPHHFEQIRFKSVLPKPASSIVLPKKRKNPLEKQTPEELNNFNKKNLREKCEEIKTKIIQYKSLNNGTIGYELKLEVIKLMNKFGNHNYIALILGIHEKVLTTWRYCYSKNKQKKV